MLTLIGIALVALILLFSVVIVRQQELEIIERLGKYNRVARPGLSFKIPIIDSIIGTLELRVQQLNFTAETKTKDDVFVNVKVAVQYMVNTEKAYDAFYRLQNPKEQIGAYIFDVIRSEVPKMKLDEAFEQKDTVAKAVKEQLANSMDDFGYTIIQALIIDVEPAPSVKEAMNEIQTQTRLRAAAAEKGEADKVLAVKSAEAEAESKRLQGEGIAQQRLAIVKGLRESVEMMEKATGIKGEDVMNLVLLTQYFDTLKDIGGSAKSTTVFLPSSPEGMKEFSNAIRTAILSSK